MDHIETEKLNYGVHENGYWYGEDVVSEHRFDKCLAIALVHFFKSENVKSIVDFGCGTSDYVKTMLTHQIDCEGYDGNPDTFKISGGIGKVADLSQPLNLDKNFDWVMSLEVGEHIPKQFERTFIETLHAHNKKGIILSWAIKGQGGFGHFNEQDNDYIKEIMGQYGYINDTHTENLLRNSAEFSYFKNTIMVFRKIPNLKINHWCRIVMNRHTEKFIEQLGASNLDVLEISGSAWKHTGFKSYEQVNYPDFDICKDRKLKQYDIIIAEQIFEHISHPALAAKNILGMLKQGGTLLITTPFLIHYHPHPLDLWRWTEMGLKIFLTDMGFSEVESHSWGNRKCIIINLDNWVDYNPALHSLENEPNYPIVVWAYAKKTHSPTIINKLATYYKFLRRKITKRMEADLKLFGFKKE